MIDKKTVSEFIAAEMERAGVRGVGVAVIENRQITFDEVFGSVNKSGRSRLQKETQFQAASLSKPVLAYLVIKLHEIGRINLDVPLIQYWPQPFSPDPRAATLTARHVLTHTTGFPNWRSDDDVAFEIDPGQSFGYSGEGFQYLQGTIEHLTGMPLHDYAQTNLFEPLGMHHTTFAWGLDDKGGFLLDDDNDVLPPIDQLFSHAAFSLLTSASDYARFLLAMLTPEKDHAIKINRESTRLMLAPQIKVGKHAALSWGLGWGIQHHAAGDGFWHWGGAQNNYWNYCIGFQEIGLGIVITTNDKNGQNITETIAKFALGQTAAHPAFEWIRPIDSWDARGL